MFGVKDVTGVNCMVKQDRIGQSVFDWVAVLTTLSHYDKKRRSY